MSFHLLIYSYCKVILIPYLWCRLETLECAPLKVSGLNPPGANFCGLVHAELALALNGPPLVDGGIGPLD